MKTTRRPFSPSNSLQDELERNCGHHLYNTLVPEANGDVFRQCCLCGHIKAATVTPKTVLELKPNEPTVKYKNAADSVLGASQKGAKEALRYEKGQLIRPFSGTNLSRMLQVKGKTDGDVLLIEKVWEEREGYTVRTLDFMETIFVLEREVTHVR